MRIHHNPNKVPPFKPDPEHWTKKVHSWKAKVAYETEDDAWEFLNQNPKLKAKDPVVGVLYVTSFIFQYIIKIKRNSL